MRIRHATLALVAFVSVATVAGCTRNATWQGPNGVGATTTGPASAELTFSYDDGATNVSPGEPVTVQVKHGTLQTVTLSSNVGDVKGLISDDGLMWSNMQDLEYGKTYTLTVSSTGDDGKPVEQTRTFTTVTVQTGYYWNVYFDASAAYGVSLDGGTFGVGQPIIARFDDTVDKKVAEETLSVQTTPPVNGSWYWVNDEEAHWRPQSYWTPGTKVTVSSKGLGVTMTTGDGRELHGQENKSATFTVGDSKVAKVDNNTHMMTVYINGAQAHDPIPVSLGQDTPYRDMDGTLHDFRTGSGVMVVTEKHDPVLMKPNLPCPSYPIITGPGANCDPNYYEAKVNLAVRITDQGVYVHSAPWSVSDQGHDNVSHGCINISPTNAQWFYNTFNTGDVVEVANTGRQATPQDDGGILDWNVPWDRWLAGSALHA
jgi:lipoprotein-anchoring transpeptidase ErfK/SrfK